MKYKLLIFLFVLVAACKKNEDYDHIEIIGHGGMGMEHPMSVYHDNTKEAVQLALEFPGITGVELDVQMDMDGELWLYHDLQLENETDRTGCIGSLHTDEITGTEYTSFHREKLCRLDDILPHMDSTMVLFVDIKSYNVCNDSSCDPEEFLSSLLGVVVNSSCQIRVILSDADWLPYFLPHFSVFYSSDQHTAIEDVLNTIHGLKGIVVRNLEITKNQVQFYQSNGVEVFLYEMRSANGIKKALRKHPNGIIPDDIRRALIEGR